MRRQWLGWFGCRILSPRPPSPHSIWMPHAGHFRRLRPRLPNATRRWLRRNRGRCLAGKASRHGFLDSGQRRGWPGLHDAKVGRDGKPRPSHAFRTSSSEADAKAATSERLSEGVPLGNARIHARLLEHDFTQPSPIDRRHFSPWQGAHGGRTSFHARSRSNARAAMSFCPRKPSSFISFSKVCVYFCTPEKRHLKCVDIEPQTTINTQRP